MEREIRLNGGFQPLRAAMDDDRYKRHERPRGDVRKDGFAAFCISVFQYFKLTSPGLRVGVVGDDQGTFS